MPTVPTSLIDIENDTLITVEEITEQRLGKAIGKNTAWRWIREGINGVRLEAVKVAGSWRTTPAAFAAFIKAQTAAALVEGPGPARVPRSPEKTARLRKAGLIK